MTLIHYVSQAHLDEFPSERRDPATCDHTFDGVHANVVFGDATMSPEQDGAYDVFCLYCSTVICSYDAESPGDPDRCGKDAAERVEGFAFCAEHAPRVRALATK